MTPTLVVTSFIFILIGKAIFDRYLILEKKESPNHPVEIVIVIGLAILHGIFVANVNWDIDDYTKAVIFFYPMCWWALFDGVLNLMLGRKWFELGRTATSDKLFRRLGQASYELSKWVATGLMLYCIYLIYTEWT